MTLSRTGLTTAQALTRLKTYGPNRLDEKSLATQARDFFKVLLDPMGLMLVALAIVYLTLGEKRDALILAIAYLPIAAVDVALELRSQKALRALKRSIKTLCQVIRDGKLQSIPTEALVPGDLLVTEEGQTLPADGVLLEASSLTLDESTVTGESVPVEKSPGNEALSGTTVLTGTGLIEVQKTGFSSQIGAIAQVLKELEGEPSPLLRAIQKAVRIAFGIALLLTALVFAAGIMRGQAAGSSLISALTLAMASIPEEFPLVFTLYLSLAAFRLSRHGILVKSLPAVEGLGRVDVICTDKTGTLTEGRFKLDRVRGASGSAQLMPDQKLALLLACEVRPVDAMEAAIQDWLRETQGQSWIDSTLADWELREDRPFDPITKTMSHVWVNRATGRRLVAMKGAFEGVVSQCAPDSIPAGVHESVQESAASGRRLLALASTHDDAPLRLAATLDFTDPVRESVPAALASCMAQGIGVKMLTGDHLLTAHAIADQIGLPHEPDQLHTGPDLAALDTVQRTIAYQRGVIFARLTPTQKLELVQALKARGDIVAMTGDGVNDAPALKTADIGISMGNRATDVARSTARLVLLKNDFSGIVHAIQEGKRVLKSLSQSLSYLIAFHIPIVGVALFQAFFMEKPILAPIHIVLLELIVHPISAFVFDEGGVEPVGPDKSLLTRENWLGAALRGLTLTAGALLLHRFGPGTPEQNTSAAVLLLVLSNTGLLLAERGGIAALGHAAGRGRTLGAIVTLWALGASLIYIPWISELFKIKQPEAWLFSALIAGGLAPGLLVSHRSSHSKHNPA